MRTFNLLPAETASAEIGARLKRLRLQRNLSQQQVADMVAASLSSLRRLESQGHGSLTLLLRVAQALHVAGEFDALFQPEVHTIAQAEQAARLDLRQRARVPRSAKPA